MNFSIKTLSVALLSSFFLYGCSFNKVTEEAQHVLLVSPKHVTHCEKLGKTIVQIKSSFIGVSMPTNTLERELKTIAKNDAAHMGGDTIVALTEIEAGVQTFQVYRCK